MDIDVYTEINDAQAEIAAHMMIGNLAACRSEARDWWECWVDFLSSELSQPIGERYRKSLASSVNRACAEL